MIVVEQGFSSGWNPNVVLASLANLESDVSGVSEELRVALYRSWFAEDTGVRPDSMLRGVRPIAWVAAVERPQAFGGDRAARRTD